MNTNSAKRAYKPSDVGWSGRLPKHWEVVRLRGAVANVVDLTGEVNRDDIYLALEHVESWTGRFAAANDSVEFDGQSKRFQPGDVLFGKLRPYLAKVACPDRDGVCAGEFLVLRPGNVGLSAKYLELVLRSKPVIDAIDGSTFGAKMPRADWQFIGNMPLPLPSITEQRSIVRFLDHADRRIRRYIRAKERLIELLEEQKQAIIHQSVTGQIDVRTGQPYPAYKESGVEWLRVVPEHWEVRRSKRLFRPRKERARKSDIQLAATQAYGVIAQDDYEARVGRKVVKILRHLDRRRHVEVDDFVINMRSFQGGLERAWISGCIRSSYVVLRPTGASVVGYFSYLFKSTGYITALQSTANFIRDGQDLNFDNFRRVDLPLPPIEEQRRIAAVLDRVTADVGSSLAERSRRQVELMQEYRACLIADVVTGKLDVREAAASLPDTDPLTADDPSDNPETQVTTQGDFANPHPPLS